MTHFYYQVAIAIILLVYFLDRFNAHSEINSLKDDIFKLTKFLDELKPPRDHNWQSFLTQKTAEHQVRRLKFFRQKRKR